MVPTCNHNFIKQHRVANMFASSQEPRVCGSLNLLHQNPGRAFEILVHKDVRDAGALLPPVVSLCRC